MSNFNFVTGAEQVYSLAGNDWFAVSQDNEKVMLVDTDCQNEEKLLLFETEWSYNECDSADGQNGQALLECTNCIVDTCFSEIKYAIIPKTINAGTAKIENAYMWPMDRIEFSQHRDIGAKIFAQTGYESVWTRSVYGVNGANHIAAWCVDNDYGELSPYCVADICHIAPAFYLKKSAINYVTEEGLIILKDSEEVNENNKDFAIDSNSHKLKEISDYVSHLLDSNLLLSQITKTNHLSDDALKICVHILSLTK